MLRAMREPLKRIQGKNACLEFEKGWLHGSATVLFALTAATKQPTT